MRQASFIVLLLVLFLVSAGEAANVLGPETFLGTFYTRDIFDSVVVDGSEVYLVWGGTGDGNTASVSVIASPTSLTAVGGYAVIRKLGTSLGQYLVWAYHGKVYRFVPLTNNRVSIYVSAE